MFIHRQISKKALCEYLTETSTYQSVHCYITWWNLTHTFWVRHFPAGRGPGTLSKPQICWGEMSPTLFRVYALCGCRTVQNWTLSTIRCGDSARPHFRTRIRSMTWKSCGSESRISRPMTVVIPRWLDITVMEWCKRLQDCSWRRTFKTCSFNITHICSCAVNDHLRKKWCGNYIFEFQILYDSAAT